MTLFSFTEDQLVTGFLVIVRVLSLIATNPLFGHRNVAMRIRVIFGVLLGLILLPVVPTTPGLSMGMGELTLRVMQESFIGLSMGFLVTVLFSVVAVSGHLISTSAGMAMASLFDPSLQSEVPVIGALAGVVAFLLLLATDLHHMMLRSLAWSFIALPPGSGFGGARAGFYLTKLFTVVLEVSLTISLPVIMVVFLINLAMAVIARIAPQMNVFFSVGSVLNLEVSLLLIAISFPIMAALFMQLFGEMGQYLVDLVGQFR